MFIRAVIATAPVDTVMQTTNYYWDLFQEGNVNYQDGNKECIWAMQIDYAAYKTEDKKSVLQYTRNFGPALRGNSQLMFQGTLEDLRRPRRSYFVSEHVLTGFNIPG